MSQQRASGPDATAPAPSPLMELANNAAIVAEQAEKSGKIEGVRAELRERLAQEVEWNSKSRRRQFEQAVVWRRWNIGLGLTAGLLTAAAGSTALFAQAPAAIIGLVATFTTGALATLNAGQRKTQSQIAAVGYQEIESFAHELLDQLPYLPLVTALQQADLMTARRLQLNQTAEPPSSRALYRVERADRESGKYGRALTFSERNPLSFWAKRPQAMT